jgi:hypothetical protein
VFIPWCCNPTFTTTQNNKYNYKDESLLGHRAVQSRWSRPAFHKCVLPPSHNDGGTTDLWNVGQIRDYTALCPRRLHLHTRLRENLKSHKVKLHVCIFRFIDSIQEHTKNILNRTAESIPRI